MRTLLVFTSITLLLLLLLTISIMPGQPLAVQADSDGIGYLPAVFGYKTILPPATMVPPAATPTNTATATLTSTATAIPTNTATATPTSTATATPTSTATATATPTTTPEGTPVDTPTATATLEPGVPPDTEMIFYRWDGEVTAWPEGIPGCFLNIDPLPEEWNGDWTGTPNFAQGSLQFRAQVSDMPSPPKVMTMQLCVWQSIPGESFGLENCADRGTVAGNSSPYTWSDTVEGMWMKNGDPIEWDRPRKRYGVVIRNLDGEPVSHCFDFSGENRKEWFPLYLDFTGVVVAQGETFSGWQNYD